MSKRIIIYELSVNFGRESPLCDLRCTNCFVETEAPPSNTTKYFILETDPNKVSSHLTESKDFLNKFDAYGGAEYNHPIELDDSKIGLENTIKFIESKGKTILNKKILKK